MKTSAYIMSILVLFVLAIIGIDKVSPGTAQATESVSAEVGEESETSLTRLPIRAERRNLVGVEIGGKGILTANYERYFTPRMGIGLGLTGLVGPHGGVASIPMYLSVNPIGDVHSLYLSGGVKFLMAVAGDNSYGTAVGTCQIGYQLQLRGGFTLRPTLTCVFLEEGAFVWPGLGIAGSF